MHSRFCDWRHSHQSQTTSIRPPQTLPNAVFGAGFAASLVGVKLRGRLPQGTRVTAIKSTPAIIIACHGTVPPDNDAADLFRSTSGNGPNVEEQFGDESCDGSNMGARLPADLFEGEFVMDNLLGVGIHILTTLAKLQAGDLAKVEAMLTDDTVRIVDRTFKHYSAIGDEQIYNDGRLNHRVDATSYPHEAAGVPEDKSPKATSNSGVVEPDPISPTGRWRYSHYRGYLGDFMHFFITDPVAGIAQLAQERAGKLHVHAGNDGTLIVRSVSDIVFERVSRISVPIEQKEYFHPDGNTVADYAKPTTTHLESWNFDPTKPWKAAYYLRDYARWLSQRHAYARFLQADKDWRVAPDSEGPEPSYGNQEKDRDRIASVRSMCQTRTMIQIICFSRQRRHSEFSIRWLTTSRDIVRASGAPRTMFKQKSHDYLKEPIQKLAGESVLIGTSSWKYPGWCGQIYDEARYITRKKFSQSRFERECLDEYAEIFPTVCVDAGYYNFPSAPYLQSLAKQVPETFRFGFKVTDAITIKNYPGLPRFGDRAGKPNANFLNADLFTQAFLSSCNAIRDKVGVLIFEFSHFYPKDFAHGREFMEMLDGFLSQLPRSFSYAVEVRNKSLLQPEYFQMLGSHGVAHVFNSWAKMPEVSEQIKMPGAFSTDFTVARLLLKPGRAYEQAVKMFSPYQTVQDPYPGVKEAAKSLISHAKGGKRPSFIFVNNRLEGNAPGTIASILQPAESEIVP